MFTNNEIDKAIAHLNYPVLDWAITTVTRRMFEVSMLSAEAEARVRTILANLDTLETDKLTKRNLAGVKKLPNCGVSEAEYFQGGVRADLQSEYRYWQNELAIATSLQIWNQPRTNQIIRS
jgi:hypothetical protein